jgi:hypothetical protein
MVWIYPIEKDSNHSRSPRGIGRREPPLLGNKAYNLILVSFHLHFLSFSLVLRVELNHSLRLDLESKGPSQRKRIYSPTLVACQNLFLALFLYDFLSN